MSDEKLKGPVKRLFGSSKGLVVIVVTALSFAALFLGKTTFADVEGLLKWVLGPWLAAVGLEDAAKHVAGGMTSRANAIAASIPPPAPPAVAPSVVGKKTAVGTVRDLLQKAVDDAHLVLTVEGATAPREVAAFIHPAGKDLETTLTSILESAEEEAEEHPGEIRKFTLTDDKSKASVSFSLGYA